MTKVAVEVKPNVFLAADLEDKDIKELVENDVAVYEVRADEDKQGKESGKKGLVLFIPGVPETAILIGAATIGIVSGAASTIGSRIGEKIWPKK